MHAVSEDDLSMALEEYGSKISVTSILFPSKSGPPSLAKSFSSNSMRLTSDSNNKILLTTDKGQSSGNFQFNAVLTSPYLHTDLYRSSITRPISALVEGTNVCFLTMAESGLGSRVWGTGENETLSLLANEIFGLLGEKQTHTQMNSGSSFEFSLSAQFVELSRENAFDLFSRDRVDAVDVVERDSGTALQGATTRTLLTAADFLRAYEEGRSKESWDANKGQAKTTTTVFLLEVRQRVHVEDVAAPVQGPIISQLMLLELPGVEKLAIDPSSLRTVELPVVNQGIIAFGDVVKKVCAPETRDFADFRQSKTTMLLKEPLGGNYLTSAFVCMRSDAHNSTRAVLDHASRLQRVFNYPLVNDSNVQALLRRHRAHVLQLRSEVALLRTEKAPLAAGASDTTTYLQKIHELEGKMLQENLEKLKLKEERDKLVDKLVEIRNKQKEAEKAASDLQSELVKSEEDRLALTKALVEMQIENNSLLEKMDTDKFEIVNKLLTAETDVVDLETKLGAQNKELMEMRQQRDQAIADKREMAMEFVALKTNFLNLTKDVSLQRTRNEEISLELVNLANAKSALLKEKDTWELQRTSMAREMDELKRRMALGGLSLEDLPQSRPSASSAVSPLPTVTDGGRAMEEYRARESRLRASYENRINELENQKLMLEKKVFEMEKDRDTSLAKLKADYEIAIMKIRAESESQLSKLRTEISADRKRQMSEANDAAQTGMRKASQTIQDLEGTIRQQEMTIREQQAAIKEMRSRMDRDDRGKARDADPSKFTTEISDLKKKLMQFQRENEQLKARLSSGGGQTARDDMDEQLYEFQNRAKLAEQQLEELQTFMTQETARYESEIKKLKKELAEARK